MAPLVSIKLLTLQREPKTYLLNAIQNNLFIS